MNKVYLLIVLVLVIATIAVGGFAIYRTVKSQAPATTNSYQSPITTPYTTPSTAPTTQPVASDQPVNNNLKLTVSSPTDGLQTDKATLTVSGTTTAGADVTVNDKELKAGSNGKFQATLTLEEGENSILVFASDDNGNFAEWQGTVTYTPTN